MVNINFIEKSKNKLLADLKPFEMEAYLKYLINNLYEAFIEHDTEKALANKDAIEEATTIYEAEGYVNSIGKELEFRLAKANDLLVETLEAKQEKEIELYKVIDENYYSALILDVNNANTILKSLITSYEKAPSEELLSAINDVAEIENNRLLKQDYLLENKIGSIFPDEVEILINEYGYFQELQKKINKL